MSDDLKAKLIEMLEADEDDVETRLVYADLLEELGEDDEAERQRDWNDSKQWMVEFCAEHADYDDFGYDDLMYWFDEIDSEEEIYVSMGHFEGLMYAIREQADEFWSHWSILTGIEITREQIETAQFRCAC